ncbi:unnamed protein product [Closterium sp. Naga37s-1]|nr:unnamed protein product [Closterium sp. Naga37s-1]
MSLQGLRVWRPILSALLPRGSFPPSFLFCLFLHLPRPPPFTSPPLTPPGFHAVGGAGVWPWHVRSASCTATTSALPSVHAVSPPCPPVCTAGLCPSAGRPGVCAGTTRLHSTRNVKVGARCATARSMRCRRDSPDCVGAFPEPHELARLEIPYLTSRCGLGYRGPRIAKLAADVASGTIDLEALQRDCLLENPPSGCDMAAVGAEREMAGQAGVGGGEGGEQADKGVEMRGADDVGVDARRGAGRRKRRRKLEDDGRELNGVEAAEEAQTLVAREDSSAAARKGGPCHGTAPLTHTAIKGRRQADRRGRAGSATDKEEEVGWEEAVRQRVQRLPGLGPFSSANVLQCMGVFCFVPADSETIRHLKARGHAGCTAGTVDALAARAYAAHAPFQFLAYWQSACVTRGSTLPGANPLLTLKRLTLPHFHLPLLTPLPACPCRALLMSPCSTRSAVRCSAAVAVGGRHGRWDIWGEYERVFGPMAHLPSSRYPAITGHSMRAAGGAGGVGRGAGGKVSDGGGSDAVEGKAGGGGGGGGVMVSAQRRRTGRRRSQGESSSPATRSPGDAEGGGGVDEGGAGRGGRGGESCGDTASAGVVSAAGEVAAVVDAAAAAVEDTADGRVCVQCSAAGMGVRRSRRVMAQRSQRGSASGTAACSACSARSRGVEQQGAERKSRERGSGKGRRRGHSGGGERGGDTGVGRIQGPVGGGRRGSAAVGRGRRRGRSELERDEVGGSEGGEESGGEAGMEMVPRKIGLGQQGGGQQEGEEQGGRQVWVQGELQAGSFHTGGEVGVAAAWVMDDVQTSNEGGVAGGQEEMESGKGRPSQEGVVARHRPNRRLLL